MKKLIKLITPNILKEQYRQYKYRKNIKLFEGDNVVCPICNSKFRIFGPAGLLKRENAKCHRCGSLERHRLIWMYITQKLAIVNSDKTLRLLHFAPKKAFYDLFSASNNIEYTPCDLFPEGYDYKGNVQVVKADITNIPFENEYFDFIICSHVLEHIPNDNLVVSQVIFDKLNLR